MTVIGPDRTAELYRAHLGRAQAMLAAMLGNPVEASASGCIVTSRDGREFLDCGGHGVFLLGHRHPVVVDAVKSVLDRQPLSSRLLLNPDVAAGAEALMSIAPPGLTRLMFQSAGAEAIETALKLARLAGRWRVLSADGGYHGKTLGALTLMGSPTYRDPFLPLLPGAEVVPFGDVDAMRDALRRHPGEWCVVLEPVQGEGGVRIPPPEYLPSVAAACHEFGALLVLDEIQTGLGRTGAWWCGAAGVVPDILVCGKILGGGVVPASATLTTPALFRPLDRDPGLHSSTFSNAPLVGAAAAATIEVLRDGLLRRAADLGGRLLAMLTACAREHGDLVVGVRGAGLLLGLEFVDAGHAGSFLLELLGRGVMPTISQTNQRTVRFTPSALLTDAQLTWLDDAVSGALAATSREMG